MKILRWMVFAWVLALVSTTLPARAVSANAALDRMQALAASVHAPHVTSLQAQQHTAAWTVLVYMAADNDLESYAIADLNEMEFIGSTDNLNVVVQVDRSPRYDSTNGDWSGARRYFMTQDTDLDNVASQQVGDLGVINMGDPATLKDFITWGIKTYPAQHYGLVIWDHGGSWLGVGIDDSADDDALQLPELDSALKDSLADSQLDRLDLVGFDACLMGSIEVYRTLAPYARYAVASPELIPGQGWDYAGAFGAIADDPTVDAPTFGHAIVDSFNTFYTQIVTNYDYFSLGLIDLSQTASVVSALDSFTGSADSANAGEAIARARSKALVFGAFDDPQYADIWAATDMLGLMQQVQAQTEDSQIVDASKAVIDAGQKLVLYHLTSKTLEDSQGVSIYFPRTATFFTDKNRDTRYGQDTPPDLSPWQKFLGTFYSFFARSNPSALITGATTDHNQAVFKLSFNTGGLSDALFYIALKLNNKPILVDYRRFAVGDFPSSGTVEPTVTWAKNIPVVSDGTTQVPALLIKDRRNPLRGIINGTFIPQNGDPQVAVQVLFDLTDPNLGKSISVWGIRDSLIGPMPSQINAQPGDKFVPAWLSIGANGQLNTRSSDQILTFSTQPLTYFFVDAPAAVYAVGVQAVSPAGDVAVTTTEAQVSSSGVLTVSTPNPPTEDNTPESPTQPPSTPLPAPTSNSSPPSDDTATGSPAQINPVGSSTVVSQVGEPISQPFEVKVVDSNGHGVPGQSVTFSAPSSGPGGTFAPPIIYAPNTLDQIMAALTGASSALAQEGGTDSVTTQTGSDGTAQSTQFTANHTAGSYDVTATLSNGLTFTFHLTNTPGPAFTIEAASGGSQSTELETDFATALQARVTDLYGNSVSGITVTFTSPNPDEGAGASFPEAATTAEAVTDALGLATAPTLTANSYSGDFTVEASFDLEPDSGGTPESDPTAYFDLTNTLPPAIHLEFSSAPTSAVVNQSFSGEIEVYVYDQDGNAITSGSVDFVGPGTGAGVTFDNAEGNRYISAAIDATGHASSGPIHATTRTGTYNVHALIGEEASASVSLTNLPDVAVSLSANAGTPQSTVVSTAFTTALQAKVADQYGNGVPGVSVTFGSADAAEVPGGTYASSGSADDVVTTDANGVATASTLTANPVAGTFQVSASASGIADPATFALTNLPDVVASLEIASAAEVETTTVGAAFPDGFEVTAYDQYNNPVPGAQIHYSAPITVPSGSFADPGELEGQTAPYRDAAITTDSSGSATPSTFSADQQSGSYTVNVTYDDVGDNIHLQYTINLTNTPDVPAYVLKVNGSDEQSTLVATPFGSRLKVKVTDQYGNPIPNITVSLTAPATGASGTFTGGLSSVSDMTLSDGIYQPPQFAANTTAGAYSVTVDTPGYTLTEPSFTLTNLPGGAAALQSIDSSQTAVVGQAFASPLRVEVVDSFGNGVSGVSVVFSAPASGASGTFAATGTSSETVTSDASGIATSSAFSANHTAGDNYIVTASSDGLTSALLALSNLHDAASTVAVYSGAGQQKELSGDYGSLVAQVADQYGNPVSGISVVFSAPSSGASGTFAGTNDITETQVSAGNGRATSSTFSANGTAGDFTVSASAVSTFASFPLVNLNPPPHTTSISPSSYTIGDSPITSITINGSGFVDGVSVPQFDSHDRTASGAITSAQIIMNILANDLTTAGYFDVTAFNPFTSYISGTPAGSSSEAQTFTVYNTTPVLTSLQTTTLTAAGSGGSMTVTGSNFVSGAKVHWLWTDGGGSHDVTMTTQFNSGTQLTYDYSSADIANGIATVHVEVHNPAPVNAPSNQLNLTINNPVPAITSATDHGFVNDGDTTIDVYDSGNHYVSSSVVSVDTVGYGPDSSTPVTTTYIDSGHLTAVIPAANFGTRTQFDLYVTNPTPGGGDSNAYPFAVYDPTPTISSVSPTSTDQDAGFTLTINGTGFVDFDTGVIFNGTTYNSVNVISSTQLSVDIDESDTATAGDVNVQVVNPYGYDGSPQAVYSNTQQVTLTAPNPTPVLTSISQNNVCVGTSSLTLTVSGSGFVNDSKIIYRTYHDSGDEEQEIDTTYSDGNTLTGDFDSAALSALERGEIFVRNPNPIVGGGSQDSEPAYFNISDTIDVNNEAELLQAIADACWPNIHIDQDISVTNTVALNRNVTIDGATEGTYEVTGNGTDPIFSVPSSVTATIHDLRMTGAGGHGAIDNDGTLTLDDVYVHDNDGHGIYNTGTLNISSSTVQDNGHTNADGSGIYNTDTLTADFVQFQDNGTGLAANGGGLYNSGTATVTNSAFQNNSADKGGGIYNDGSLKAINVTFWDSSGTEGASVYGASGTSKLSFILTADSSGSDAALYGSGFQIKNSLLFGSGGGNGVCSGSSFSGTFSGVNLGDSNNCGATFAGDGSDITPSIGSGDVFYFNVDGSAIDTATDCTDVDGAAIGTSVNYQSRPFGPACDVGPVEEPYS